MKEDNKFNSFSLTDEEFQNVINRYMPIINKKVKKVRNLKEDCIQEIIISLYITLTKNRKNKKI